MIQTITLCWAADNGASIQAEAEQASSNAGSYQEADVATGDISVEATAWAMLQPLLILFSQQSRPQLPLLLSS